MLKSIKFEVSFSSCPQDKNDVTTSQLGLISTAVLNLWAQRFRIALLFGLNWIGDVIFRQVGKYCCPKNIVLVFVTDNGGQKPWGK